MYRVIIDPDVVDQIAALPAAALIEYARVHDVLEVAPWNGPSHHKDNPDAKVRRWLRRGSLARGALSAPSVTRLGC